MTDLALPSLVDTLRLEAADEARSLWLLRMWKVGGRCRYCGAVVRDRLLLRHPEVCGGKSCLRQAREDHFVSELLREPEG